MPVFKHSVFLSFVALFVMGFEGNNGEIFVGKLSKSATTGNTLKPGNNTSFKECYATLLGSRSILTTRDCLYDLKSKKPLLPVHFVLKGRSTQIKEVIPPKTFGGDEYNYAIGVLSAPVTVGQGELGWTYKSLEDTGLSLKTDVKTFNCKSSENPSIPRLRRMNSAVIKMNCAGLPSTTIPGAPMFFTDPVSKVQTIVGVYRGKCLTESCATRIHGSIYQHVCEVSAKKTLNIPGCTNRLYSQATEVEDPSYIRTEGGYSSIMTMDKARGVLLLYCGKKLCSTIKCETCSFCSGNQEAVFSDLDMLKSLQHRVLVRTVDLEQLDTGIFPVEVPYIIYRKPGQNDFYAFKGQLSQIGNLFSRRVKRAKGSLTFGKRVQPPRGAKKVSPAIKKKFQPKCQRKKPVYISGGPKNYWNNDCNDDYEAHLSLSTKYRFLGQGQERHTTVLMASIVCNSIQVAGIICRSGGGNHAERNLRNYFRTELSLGTSKLGALQAAMSGKNCEFWVVLNNFPCHERCSGAGTAQQNLPDIRQSLNNIKPSSTTLTDYKLAYANFYPTLKYNPADCSVDPKFNDAINEAKAAMTSLLNYGFRPYLCRFQDSWFTSWRAAYGSALSTANYDKYKAERDLQTRCESQHMRGVMENNVPGFVWRVKDDCVYPNRRETQVPIPPLIRGTWPA